MIFKGVFRFSILLLTILFIPIILFGVERPNGPLPCNVPGGCGGDGWEIYTKTDNKGIDRDFYFDVPGCLNSQNKPCEFYAIAYYDECSNGFPIVQFTYFYTRDISCKNCNFALVYQTATEKFFQELAELNEIIYPESDPGEPVGGYRVSIAECWQNIADDIRIEYYDDSHNSPAKIEPKDDENKNTEIILEDVGIVYYYPWKVKCSTQGCCSTTVAITWDQASDGRWTKVLDVDWAHNQYQQYAQQNCDLQTPACYPNCDAIRMKYVPPIYPTEADELIEEGHQSISKVFPNPNSGKFTLFINSQINGTFLFKAFDSRGNLVYSQDIQQNALEFNHNLNINGLTNGKYLYTITQDGKKISEGSFEIIK